MVLGLHAGECLRRGGTLLGAPLSVAAEIPGHGRPGDLLLTEVFRLTVPPRVAAEVGRLQRLEGVMALAGEPAVVHRLDAGEGR